MMTIRNHTLPPRGIHPRIVSGLCTMMIFGSALWVVGGGIPARLMYPQQSIPPQSSTKRTAGPTTTALGMLDFMIV